MLDAERGSIRRKLHEVFMQSASKLSLLAPESSSPVDSPVLMPCRLCIVQYFVHMDVQGPQMLEHGQLSISVFFQRFNHD